MAIRDFIDGLSEEQAAAARFTRDPVLALAGAGSGKTRMLMGRFAHLVAPEDMGGLGADPGSIMMVTFTNKAAREMRERIQPILEDLREMNGGMYRGDPWIGTFHGLSLRILRIEADKAGLGRNFSIFDEPDAKALVKDVVEEMGFEAFDRDEFFKDLETAKARMLDPAFLAAGLEKLRAAQGTPAASQPDIVRWRKIMGHFTSENFVEIYARYQGALQEQNAVDFNDLLNRTTRLMQQSEEVRNAWRSSFRHFMVDEVQDINRAQVSWLMAMTDGGREMAIPENARTTDYGDAQDGMHEVNTYRLRKFPRPTVAFVGDDDQSIYAFRGSEVAVMRGLEQRFPGLEKKFLKTSYRCQPAILAASNTLVSRNQGRFGKDLEPHAGAKNIGAVRMFHHKTPDDEIKRIAVEAEAYMSDGGDPSEFAVLTRTRDLAKAVAKGLRASGLPVVEGKSSDLRKTVEARDVMGYVTHLVNPDAEVPLRRIINVPSRGLGSTSLRKVTLNARLKNVSFIDELNTVINDRVDLPDEAEAYKPAFVRSVKAFGRLIDDVRGAMRAAPDARTALLEVLRRTGYLDDMYQSALKSGGLASRMAEVKDLEPRDFLKWVLRNNKDGSPKDQKQDSMLEGEDLADRAAQVSEAARRIGNIALLLDETDSFDSLEAFAQESVLEMNQVQAPAGIQVLTMHASKGLEFDHVRLPFWIEGVMPHGRAAEAGEEEIEEERRLGYVAITRGRLTVEITRPKNIANSPFLRQRFAKPSRFMEELTMAGKPNARFAALREDLGYLAAPVTKEKAPAPKPAARNDLEARPPAPANISYEERFADAPPPLPDEYPADMMEAQGGQDFDPGWDPRLDELPPESSYELDLGYPEPSEQDREEDPIPF